MSKRLPPWARLLVGGGVLAALLGWVDAGAVLERLSGLSAGWVAVALGVGVLQTVLSAWRWRYTAGRLGLDLPLGTAVAEYYLGVFLNQLLPGGVLGDAARGWRHGVRGGADGPALRGTALRAVVIERASGQIVMGAVAVASLVVLARSGGGGVFLWVAAGVSATLLAVGAWAFGVRGAGRVPAGVVARFREDARRALLGGRAPWVQGGASAAIVGSYVVTYLLAARAVGIDLPFGTMAPLVAPVLLAMLVPVTVAGWGLREGAAAALWATVGLGAAEGVATSVAYGLVVLVGTLPGAAVLAWSWWRQDSDAGVDSARSNRTSVPSG